MATPPSANVFSHRTLRLGLVLLAIALWLPLPAVATESIDREKESALRAAFLYRLAFFIKWPESELPAGNTLAFCVIGDENSPVGRLLAEQAGERKVLNRPVEVRSVKPDDSLQGCHIAYAEQAPKAALPTKTLLVVDSLQQLSRVGALALVRQTQPGGEIRLAFVGRRERLAAAPFQVSAKLLQLVRFEDPGERS